ncbi:MAG: SpoIID/LytB domain-containing protein [Candidatus Omnitrophota bacterium]
MAIVEEADSLSLKVNGSYEIIDSVRKASLAQGNNLKTTVTVNKNHILIGKVNANTKKVMVKPGRGVVLINGRQFKGKVEFIRKLDGGLLCVNHIDLEEYIKGILYHETSHYWPIEALKAQAITSRTFAVNQMRENKEKDFDVTSDIYSQVYGGKYSERLRTNRAVDDTKGRLLTYQNKVFPAFFHATCAGHTEDASLLWNINILPLKGVACGFCKEAPHFQWHYVLTLKEIRDSLEKGNYNPGEIRDIHISGRDKSGRVTNLKIVSKNKETVISAKDFRQLIGPNIIRSTNFTVAIVNHDAVFEGFGWGHGVGLCQWGAYFMAKQGRAYEEILKHYYPGAEISSY